MTIRRTHDWPRIDVHHHILPPAYVAEARDGIVAVAPTNPTLFDWTPQRAVETMDKAGIDVAVTSISTPGIWFRDAARARRLARLCNEYAAQMARDFPGRFGTFGALPLPDVDGSLKEIEYCADVLKVDGFCVMSSYDDKWPGDPAFAPIFDELNRRKAVVFVHPTVPGCCVGLVPDIAPAAMEFLFDSTRAIASLIYSGTTTRCSDLRFVFSHGGGTIPFTAYRVIGVPMKKPKLAARVPEGPLAHIRKFYYDIATLTDPIAITALRQLVGIEKILYGTDEPFSSAATMADDFAKLNFSLSELNAIEWTNGLSLLPTIRR